MYSFLNAATFSTLTNVNFDDERFKEYIGTAHELRAVVEVRCGLVGRERVTRNPKPALQCLRHTPFNSSAKRHSPGAPPAGRRAQGRHRRLARDPRQPALV